MAKKITFIVLVFLSLLILSIFPKHYVFSYLMLFLAFSGVVYEFLFLELKLKKEISEFKNAIVSITEDAEPEVLFKNKNIKILSDLKIDVYELARVLVDDVDFLRQDVLNNIDVPIYIESSGRNFKNKSMKKLCMDLKTDPLELDDTFYFNEICYTKIVVRENFFYFLPRTKIESTE